MVPAAMCDACNECEFLTFPSKRKRCQSRVLRFKLLAGNDRAWQISMLYSTGLSWIFHALSTECRWCSSWLSVCAMRSWWSPSCYQIFTQFYTYCRSAGRKQLLNNSASCQSTAPLKIQGKYSTLILLRYYLQYYRDTELTDNFWIILVVFVRF